MYRGLAAQQSSSALGNGCCGPLEAHLLLQGPAAGPCSQDAHVAGSVEGMLVRSLVVELGVLVVVVQAGVIVAVLVAADSAIVERH